MPPYRSAKFGKFMEAAMKSVRFFVLTLTLLLLVGCAAPAAPAAEPCRYELAAMDTFMTLTVYGLPDGEAQTVLQRAAARIRQLEELLSVTSEGSEIYKANHAGGEAVSLSADTRELLSEALALCRDTDGALDVTIYPVVRAWGFTTGDYRVPEEAELAALLEKVDDTQARLDGDRLTLPEGMELDLGAVAKGWTGDRLMELFREAGAASAIVELGGNVQALGTRPDGSPWRVAVQAPEGGYAGALEIADKAVITSGGYQRYFEQDGVTYCHIIDPATGRPARTGLASVTVVADRGAQGDGLSTALFVMGRERAEAYWREHPGFDFILLGEDGTAAITEGLEDSFSLYGAWEDRPLEIIRK